MAVKKARIVFMRGRKKTAVARVRVKAGAGSIRINSRPLAQLQPDYAARVIAEPLTLATGVLGTDIAAGLDIDINVAGGGTMGQAYACRTGLGKALLAWSESEELKAAYLAYDRSLLIDDARLKEPKKYLRKGARAKPIKSYR